MNDRKMTSFKPRDKVQSIEFWHTVILSHLLSPFSPEFRLMSSTTYGVSSRKKVRNKETSSCRTKFYHTQAYVQVATQSALIGL